VHGRQREQRRALGVRRGRHRWTPRRQPLSRQRSRNTSETNNQPQNEELSPRRGGGVGTMCEYPAVDSDARGRGSGVRVVRDL
jgi:hypothetical protein